LQRALRLLRFLFMQLMIPLSLPSELMHSRMTSEVHAARCAEVPRAKLALENSVPARMITLATTIRDLRRFEFTTLSCVRVN
jgi:hypothetical protein